ncbi:hypothetical protein M885DRAFT_521593 [Pelagophyceae sp. CCMP2097]|nr:hypothetical protein M885DRAFT_521593 [Pelagophyceae sp. CCMP2097]
MRRGIWVLFLGWAWAAVRDAGNLVRVDGVCLRPAAGAARADGGACALRASLRDAPSAHLAHLCGNLTTCHAPAAFSRCRAWGNSPRKFLDDDGALCTEAARAHDAPGVAARTPATDGGRAGDASATRVRRAALFVLSGNIGHDLYNSLLDVFAADARLKFDAVIIKVVWFAGMPSFHHALENRSTSWSLQIVDALFPDAAQYVFASPELAQAPYLSTLPAGGLCVDELYVRAGGLVAENVGWDALGAVPRLRAAVLDRLGVRAGGRAGRRVVLYTRADAQRRRFASRDLAMAARHLGATTRVDTMPRSDPLAQIRLFADADIFVAPFGSNTANAVFMRPGSTFIEVSPLCAALCTEACHPYSRTGPAAERNMADSMRGVSRANACAGLMTDGAPLHQQSGVRYHVVSLCAPTANCVAGSMVDKTGRAVTRKKAWKQDFNPLTIDLDAALPLIEAVLHRNSTDHLVAPFQFDCPLIRA